MPDMTRGHDPGDELVARALEAVGEDDRRTIVPVRIEEAVMRAWDARPVRMPARQRPRTRAAWAAALATAACIALAAAFWFERAPDREVPAAATDTTSSDPLDAIATTGVLLQDDPASLRLVRMSVDPSVLAAYGYLVANPGDLQPVDVDVLIGLDGVPRVVRPVETDGIWSMQ